MGYTYLNKPSKSFEFPFPNYGFLLQISTNVSILFHLFRETSVVSKVFLLNFAREIGARPA